MKGNTASHCFEDDLPSPGIDERQEKINQNCYEQIPGFGLHQNASYRAEANLGREKIKYTGGNQDYREIP